MAPAFPLCLALLLPGILLQEAAPAPPPAPDPVPAPAAKTEYERIAAIRDDPRNGNDRQKAVLAAKETLEQNAALYAEGDGLHYRGRLQAIAHAEWKDGLASFLAHVEAVPDSPLADDSLVLAAQIVHGRREDWAGAKALLGRVKPDRLSAGTKPTYESLVHWVASDEAHAAMIGKPAPAFTPLKVIGGPGDFSLAAFRGRAVLLEFWATW